MKFPVYKLSFFLFVLTIIIGCGASNNVKKSTGIKIMAHRGDWRNHPENSIRAIKSCIEMGIDVEIDVRKTKDGHFIVFHDEKLDEDTNGKGFIANLDLDSIQRIFLKEGYGAVTRQKIPTLEEVLQLIQKSNSSVYLDKIWEDIPALYPLLKKYNCTQKVYFGSSQPYKFVREKVGTYLDSIQFMPFVMTTEMDRIGFMKAYLNNTKSVKTAFVLLDNEPEKTKSLLDFLKNEEIKIMFSATQSDGCAGHDDELSADNPENGWGWLINNRAGMIFTDRPKQLLEYLDTK